MENLPQTDTLAQRINAEHHAAQACANEAVQHAIEAGRLLSEARESVAHGAWLPWLAAHCEVSPRQAQRYIRIASNASRVSHMGSVRAALGVLNTPKPEAALLPAWLPRDGTAAVASLNEGVPIIHAGDWVVVQEVSHAAGFFRVLVMLGMYAQYTKRGIRADRVEWGLRQFLPGQFTREPFERLAWEYFEEPDFCHSITEGWQ
jgi:hypothetical protein